MSDVKYFWLLSDGKTVREISQEEFRRLNKQNWSYSHKFQSYLLLVLFGTEIHIAKGTSMLNVPLKQLREILQVGV